MSLFAHLEYENKVQVGDMTRFDGKRSFVSKGSNPITTMTIKPGADGSAISVFNSNQENLYLDWAFTTFSIDIDSTNNKLNFNEGGSELTATLSSGTYTLSTLATEVQTQLNSAGSNTYTVSVSSDDKVTIAATGSFSLLINEGTNVNTSILPTLGFITKPGFDDDDFATKTTVTGKRVRSMPRAVTITIGDGDSTDAITKYISVYSEDGDALFSNDSDLRSHRHDILDYLPGGRNSYKHIHRRAQTLILDWLNRAGYVDIDGEPLAVDNLVVLDEFKQWSTFMSLRIIHDELSNDPEDDFYKKARDFQFHEEKHRDRALLRIDVDNDGKADIGEGVQVTGGEVYRR